MFTRILVPTDFSPPSDAALEYARMLASKFGASLHLLHVVDDQFVTGPFGGEIFVPHPAGTLTALLYEAGERLAHRITPNDRSQLRATSELVVGTPARTIVEYAADNGFDVIMMGTHGRTGLAHVMMGSVAEKVVRTAPCPVLTVREAPLPVTVSVPVDRIAATM